MRPGTSLKAGVLAALTTGILAATPALAEKPDWAGGGHGGGKHEQRDKGRGGPDRDDRRGDDRRGERDYRDDRRAPSVSVDVHFHDRQRTVIREYYHREFSGGHCPPGLAKKHNGCMPPGQAKKWSRGRPLPRDVVYYDLPPALVVEIGVPPPGYKYVRVASDILMIAIGTSMVVDAIEDLSRM
ncbi:hypothetical protein [Azoarcus olearius]|uniref:Conserved hypothetical secreted protein n=1 Tax=Azoarcus sp. (strain BH72) TaxID=418699 RepID=A1K374_AZOSB|nr:hypothetical protein [Azoarcus olearius]ANQ83806.1 hypothetical protein dqs_0731 [Azoarcus olearius]CAL93279.1 conserved hypothetical secreted protein [Azoarcus olearius]